PPASCRFGCRYQRAPSPLQPKSTVGQRLTAVCQRLAPAYYSLTGNRDGCGYCRPVASATRQVLSENGRYSLSAARQSALCFFRDLLSCAFEGNAATPVRPGSSHTLCHHQAGCTATADRGANPDGRKCRQEPGSHP